MNDLERKLRLIAREVEVNGGCYVRLMRDKHNEVQSFEVVDGHSVAKYLTADGVTPQPPNPAYAQLYSGVSAIDYTVDQMIEISAPRPSGKAFPLTAAELREREATQRTA
jgi:hypothetical protein